MAEFVAERTNLDYDPVQNELYLYHGTNCLRRWEIKRSGFIDPGIDHLSFFCTRAADAFKYARAACIRDADPTSVNSLTCEPVVLKVRINARTWLQVDLIRQLEPRFAEECLALSIAAIGPISSSCVVDVLYCTHGRRLGCSSESTRTFSDGTFLPSIYHLRETLMQKRADAWMLKHLGMFNQVISVKLSGGQTPELTANDCLRRLRQVSV